MNKRIRSLQLDERFIVREYLLYNHTVPLCAGYNYYLYLYSWMIRHRAQRAHTLLLIRPRNTGGVYTFG